MALDLVVTLVAGFSLSRSSPARRPPAFLRRSHPSGAGSVSWPRRRPA